MDAIRSIKIDFNSPNVCQMTCSLMEKWCFLMVDWARQSIFFKEIKIDDQIKLLKNSWVDILLLDLMWKQCKTASMAAAAAAATASNNPSAALEQFLLNNNDTIYCVNDQFIKLSTIKNQQMYELSKGFMRCVSHFKACNLQYPEYLALKYLVLFDPDVTDISNTEHVEEVQQLVSTALIEYTSVNGNSPDKFAQLLLKLPDIKLIGAEIKQILVLLDKKTFNGGLLDGCLLGEMLYGPSSLSASQ